MIRLPTGRPVPPQPARVALSRGLALALALALLATAPAVPVAAGFASLSPRRPGALDMPEPRSGSLLVTYYEQFLKGRDVEAYRAQVSARFTEGTLARLLDSPDPVSRRAAVLALGLIGTFGVNGAVAHGLRDPDPTVRALTDQALWSIWFRADSPENNTSLAAVGRLIGRQQLDEAVRLATDLVGHAPGFAEAYNQRAIAHFKLGNFRESAGDCRSALERNPHHFGALSGLAQCQVQLGRRADALDSLRRASRLMPYNNGVKQWIRELEREDP